MSLAVKQTSFTNNTAMVRFVSIGRNQGQGMQTRISEQRAARTHQIAAR